MKCKKCNGERILNVVAKCPDGYDMSISGKQIEAISIEGITDGEYVDIAICLDCGQIQHAEFPVQIEKEILEFVEDKKHVPAFTSFAELVKCCKEHYCRDKVIYSCDDQSSFSVGYICKGCGKKFNIHISDIKICEPDDDNKYKYQNIINSREGRNSLLKYFNEK